ncbi:uncharacterized protein LOC143227980 [Tachypleus tridentatus]|uniref:uncharacterized protein LOC143227980 n=1 Tax=Tachypleus tridentatus TaxID=6853 RepID=UPI003FD20147
MQEFHSWFQSMQEVDIQQGSLPPTQSTYCNSCIPDSTNTIEIRKPEVDDVQHHLTDGNQFKHQSQQSPLAQRVMWMESSFMKARPPTTVVVMATEESATEETNGSCPLSRNDDIYHEQYGLDYFEKEREEIITSLDDVLDSLLAIPSSSRSSSPVTSRRSSPIAPQMLGSAHGTREGRISSASDWTEKVESHQELPADKTSSAAILSSHVGAKECPYHEEGPFEPTATEEKSYSSLSSTTVESDFGLALRIDTNDKLVKETSQKTKGRQDSMDFKESILKTPDPQCQRHSLQEPTQYTEKPPKKLSYSFQESIDQTFELVTTLDKKQSRNESTQGQRSIMCNRPKCTKVMPEVEAQAKFRMCPNCYTYYCSKHCRKAHWDRHQDQCPYTKISNMCQQILIKVRQDPISRRNFSVCARRGYLSRGREL